MEFDYINISNSINKFDAYIDKINYEIATEGIGTMLKNAGTFLLNLIKKIIDKIVKFFQNIFMKDKLDQAVHIKMYEQFKVGYNQSKKVLDKLAVQKYSVFTDFDQIDNELIGLEEIWAKVIRLMTSAKMSNFDNYNWKTKPRAEAEGIKNTLIQTLKGVEKDIKTINEEEMEGAGKNASASLSRITRITNIIIEAYNSMLYCNKDDTVAVKADNIETDYLGGNGIQ